MECFLMDLHSAYIKAIEKATNNISRLGASFPQVTSLDENTRYNDEPARFWTGGFWGGILHEIYRETGNEEALSVAREIEVKQDELFHKFITLHHDVGFMWMPTSVEHYRLTGDQDSYIRGIKAASVLVSRFNPNGNFIRAWNESNRANSAGLAIIDCMMNLSLLYWASNVTNDPRFKAIACAHADTVIKSFIRPDYTVPHVVEFDPNTGEKICEGRGQGVSPSSRWSRGQAWALYGFAISYRETKKTEYLVAAMNIANKFYSDLPSDLIPYWDFESPEEDKYVKDSSASAIAASGLIELSLCTGDDKFKQMGLNILQSLTDCYADFSPDNEGIIKYGTVNYIKRKYINTSIIYGDFYYIEALSKLFGKTSIF